MEYDHKISVFGYTNFKKSCKHKYQTFIAYVITLAGKLYKQDVMKLLQCVQ